MKKNIILPNSDTQEKIFSKLSLELQDVKLPVLSVVSEMVRFSTIVSSYLDTHFQRYGLSQPGFLTLMILYSDDTKQWTAILLAEELNVKAPTMTGILDTLEKLGYISRIPSKTDRRKNYIELSKSGKSKLKKILPDHISKIQSAFGQLKSNFLKEANSIFSELESSLEKLIEGVR